MFEENHVVKVDKSAEVKKAILEYLDEHGTTRATKLKRHICDLHPVGLGLCSEKIHIRNLKQLVATNRVKTWEMNRGNISYHLPSWIEYQNMTHKDAVDKVNLIVGMLADEMPSVKEKTDHLYVIFTQIMDLYGFATLFSMFPSITTGLFFIGQSTMFSSTLSRTTSTTEGKARIKLSIRLH